MSVRNALVSGGVALLLAAAPAAAQLGGVKVIVNVANATTSISKDDLSKIFLKRTLTWPAGTPVVAVDQPETSDVRQKFSAAVLGRSADAMKSYWMQQVFAGKGTPPAVRPSDEAVESFVAQTPGAIGYVSAGASTGAQVKAVHISN